MRVVRVALTMRRKDANVSWKALIIQVDSLSVIPKETTKDGTAEKTAVLLKASRNCAMQKIIKRAYRLVTDIFGVSPSFARVLVVERGGDFILTSNKKVQSSKLSKGQKLLRKVVWARGFQALIMAWPKMNSWTEKLGRNVRPLCGLGLSQGWVTIKAKPRTPDWRPAANGPNNADY